MGLIFFSDFFVPVIVGICLCVGYIIKHVNIIKDKWIPLIVMLIGVILNIWIQDSISADILLAGMFSGLSSTGLHQAFKQSLGHKDYKDN